MYFVLTTGFSKFLDKQVFASGSHTHNLKIRKRTLKTICLRKFLFFFFSFCHSFDLQHFVNYNLVHC